MKQLKFYLILGLLFIAGGALLGYQPLLRVLNENQVIAEATHFNAQAPPSQPEIPLIQGKPIRIVIPTLSIDLTVIDGFYNTKSKSWTLSSEKAQYATLTPYANNKQGNTFIYGHNNKKVFARLNKIQSGDKVTVYTDSGHMFTYIFKSALETNPYDDSLFHYIGPPILTLQTCSGLWYQNRQLFTFALSEAR